MHGVTRKRAQSFLTDQHIEHVVRAYERCEDEPGFCPAVGLEAMRAKDGSLNIALYIAPAATSGDSRDLPEFAIAPHGWRAPGSSGG